MQQSISAKITLASLLAFTLPTIIANVFMSIYTTVDGIFVANLVGTQALSAVNIVMPFLMVTIAIGTMLGTGGSALVAKKLGEGKTEAARRNFSLLVIVCFVTSALLSALGLLFKEPVLTLLGADESIYYYCEAYASPLFVIIPFAMLGIVFQMFFIADGKPHYGMAFSIAGGLMNILLDYLLIAKAGMGIRGAAIATGIGYAFPAVIGLFYFTFKRTGNLYFVKPRPDKTVILKAGANGSSEMVTMLSTSIVTIAMNNIMIRLAGADGVSAITILLYAQTLLSSVYMGYATGIAPITSFNFGKGDTDNLKKIHRISLRTIAAASVITFLASFFLAKPIIQVFARAGTSVYNMAMNGFLIFAVGFLFMGFNVYSSSMFTALNNGKVSAILSFFRTLVFLLAALLIFPAVWNVTGVWIAMPAAEALSILMTIYYFRKMGPVYNYA